MRKIFCIIIVVILSLSILCIGIYSMAKEVYVKDFENSIYVGFSSKELSSENVLFFYADEISTYESKYKDFNTYTYFSNLKVNDKIIYKVLEYALDNSYQYVLLDEKLVGNIEYTTIDILYFLSLDSPIVEQNLLKETKNFSVELEDILGFQKGISGTLLYIENFSKNKLELKEKSISIAQEIVRAMPHDLTSIEKSEYLYRYLRDNITYKLYDGLQDCNYLYDALCKGETQCDGFANAYSLLCNISKIPCFEKIRLPSNREAGHTWNSIQIDGVWFNVDTTINKEVALLEKNNGFLSRFCYSDRLQLDLPNWNNLLPDCTHDKLIVDSYFDTENDSNLLSAIYEAFQNNDRNYVFIAIKNSSLSNEKLQEICNNLGFNLNIVRADGSNQHCYFLIKQTTSN